MARRKLTASKSAKGRAAPRAAAGANSTELSNIRDRIDDVDARIHALLNERARFAQLVGISKTASGKAVDFYRPEREADVLRKALKGGIHVIGYDAESDPDAREWFIQQATPDGIAKALVDSMVAEVGTPRPLPAPHDELDPAECERIADTKLAAR